MKVKVIFSKPSYHPKFGRLSPGDIIEVPDDFPIDGKLFKKITGTPHKREVKDE